MTEAITVALITGVLALAGTVITGLISHRSTLAEMDKRSELSDEKIQGQINVIRQEIKDLTKTVEKHNNVIERTYELERKMGLVEERINELKAKR